MNQELFLKVRKIVAEDLNQPEAAVTPDASLFYDLGADSLDVAEIAQRIEDELEILIEFADFETVRDLVNAAAKGQAQ